MLSGKDESRRKKMFDLFGIRHRRELARQARIYEEFQFDVEEPVKRLAEKMLDLIGDERGDWRYYADDDVAEDAYFDTKIDGGREIAMDGYPAHLVEHILENRESQCSIHWWEEYDKVDNTTYMKGHIMIRGEEFKINHFYWTY